MSGQKEMYPRLVVLAVGEPKGRDASSEPPVPVFGAVQIDGETRKAPLFGVIQNKGADAFTFSVEESDNDNTADLAGRPAVADAYAGINIRVAEAVVASVVVQPKGRVVFSIEPSEVSAEFLRFKAESAGGAVAAIRHGYMSISSWFGLLEEWDTRGA